MFSKFGVPLTITSDVDGINTGLARNQAVPSSLPLGESRFNTSSNLFSNMAELRFGRAANLSAVFFDGGTDGSSGTGGSDSTNSDKDDKNQEQQQDKDKPEKVVITPAIQALLDQNAANIRRSEKDKYDKQQKEKADADALDKAKKDGELQTVINTHEATIADLRAKAERADRYATRINTSIDTETAEWPDAVKALDPGADNLEARLTWIEKSRTLVEQLTKGGKPPHDEHGKNGNNGGVTNLGQVADKAGKVYRRPGVTQK